MRLYKLTDENGRTHGTTQWGPGVTHRVEPCDNPQLCTGDVLHAYADPNLALLMNPVHGAYDQPRLWEAEGEPCVTKPDKLGCFSLTTVREMERPAWLQDAASAKRVRVRFAILAARAVLDIFESARPSDDRPRKAIEAAERYLSDDTPAYDAANAANEAANAAYAADAAYAASAAANAAYAAAYAASAAANAAYAAAYAAYAADDAAHAAADAAYAASAAANAAANAAAYAAAYAAADAAHAAADAAHAAAELDLAALARQAVAKEIAR